MIGSPATRLLYDPRFRSFCIQAAVFAIMVLVLTLAVVNTAHNLSKAGIASGFGFLSQTAGFDISQSLIDYYRTSSYGRAFWVGLLNTLLVSSVSIVLSTLLGFVVGILRMSGNWLVSRLALTYIEVVRNVPLLLQLLFWYIAILNPLPGPKLALDLYGDHLSLQPGADRSPAHPGARQLGGIARRGRGRGHDRGAGRVGQAASAQDRAALSGFLVFVGFARWGPPVGHGRR